MLSQTFLLTKSYFMTGNTRKSSQEVPRYFWDRVGDLELRRPAIIR